MEEFTMTDGIIRLTDQPVIEAAGIMTLRVSGDRRELILRRIDGEAKYLHLCEPFIGSGHVYYWMDSDRRHVVLIGGAGRAAYCVDLADIRLYIAMNLYRRIDDDYGLYHVRFIGRDDGVLVVYEGGIFYLDADMRCRWKVDHQYIDRIFVGIDDEIARYESEHEGKWGYRLSDGERVEVMP
jgi:hypothetical protein